MDLIEISPIRSYLLSLQQALCDALEYEDGKGTFKEDIWSRNEDTGSHKEAISTHKSEIWLRSEDVLFTENIQSCSELGNTEKLQCNGGITKILKKGAIIEQAGVNFSHIQGNHLPLAATKNRRLYDMTGNLQHSSLEDCHFEALGVSTVIHPQNPYVPTAHANVRFFQCQKPNHPPIWWFGGGFDLTPYYPFEEDCRHWHQTAKAACDPFGADLYHKFKTWCDEYFFLKHRNESRGIGGLFFDDLNPQNHWSFERGFAFMQSVGNHFIKAYQPIIAKRKNIAYGEKERHFQRYRRGRYVEFNLIYDRGTLFGLQSGGRTESILMSLPPECRFEYDWQPESNSDEMNLVEYFLKPRDWLNE